MQPESPTRILSLMMLLLFPAVSHAQVLGDPVDVGQDFQKLENVYFLGSRVTSFDNWIQRYPLQPWNLDAAQRLQQRQTVKTVPDAKRVLLLTGLKSPV